MVRGGKIMKERWREVERERGGAESGRGGVFEKHVYTDRSRLLTSQEASSCNTCRYISRVKHHILQAYIIYTYMHTD